MVDPLIKYVMKNDKKEDIFHTSAYGKAQSGSGIGAASAQSYNARMAIRQNRQVVRGYEDAGIVNESKSNGPRAKTYTPPKDTGLRKSGGGIRAGGPGTIAKKD